jgi:predicted methyltransferase
MPITPRRNPLDNAPEQPAAEGPSGFQSLRNWLGTGVRLGTGIASAEGFWPGALISGAGELVAQGVEGSWDSVFRHPIDTAGKNFGRIGVEAAIGAVPVGKIIKAGRVATSAAKNAAMTGVGDVGRQWAEGNFDTPDTTLSDLVTGQTPHAPGWDMNRTLLAAGIGGVTGGAVGAFTGTKPLPKPEPPIIESSGAVPRASKRDPSAHIPSGQREPNATRTGQIHSLPSPGGYKPPAQPAGPRPLPGRTPYGRPAEPPPTDGFAAKRLEREQKLDTEFQDAIRAKDARLEQREFDKLQTMFSHAMGQKASRVESLQRLEDDFANAMLEGEGRFADRMGKQRMAEDSLDTQFQDALRAKNSAMDDEEAAQIVNDLMLDEMDEVGRGVRETFTEKIPGGTRTSSRVYAPKAIDEISEVTDAAGNTTARIDPDNAAAELSAGGGPSGAIGDLLSNLKDPVAIKVYDQLVLRGETPRAAYKRAFEAQQFRANKAIEAQMQSADAVQREVPDVNPNPAASLQKLLTPASKPLSRTAKQTVKQSAHPSFYDDGFDALETAAPKPGQTPRAPGQPPAAAQAKLAKAEQTYQPEALDELKRLSAIYNDPKTPKAGRDEVGKQLRRLSNFMEGKGEFAPKGDGSKPSWVAEQLNEVKKLGQKLTPGGGKAPKLSSEKGAASVEQLLSMALGLGGGAAGAAIDSAEGDDSILDGAFIGAAGLGGAAIIAPKLLQAIGETNLDIGNAEAVTNAAKKVVAKLPQIQRSSLLLNPAGVEQGLPALGANAFAGPYGAVLTKAVEDIFKQDPRAFTLLKLAWNPAKFAKGMWESKDEALDALVRGEGNRAGVDGPGINPNSMVDVTLAAPGWAMTTGDVYARKLLKLAGYSDEEAKAATLTSEASEKFLRRQSDSAKGSWLGQMLFPFRRTLLNTVEQGAQRTPLAGFGMNKLSGRDVGTTEALVEQGLGLASGAAGYTTAASIDDTKTRNNVRRYMSNAMGRYSLPNQIGWAMGDFKARNRDPLNAIVSEQTWNNLIPLPKAEVISDFLGAGVKLAQGKADHPLDLVPDSLNFRSLRRFMASPEEYYGWKPKVADPPTLGMQKLFDVEPERKGIRPRNMKRPNRRTRND